MCATLIGQGRKSSVDFIAFRGPIGQGEQLRKFVPDSPTAVIFAGLIADCAESLHRQPEFAGRVPLRGVHRDEAMQTPGRVEPERGAQVSQIE